MLERRGEQANAEDARMAGLLQRHVQQIKAWLAAQPNFRILDIDYNQMLAEPEPFARQVNKYLSGILDEQAMIAIVDPALYRNRVT